MRLDGIHDLVSCGGLPGVVGECWEYLACRDRAVVTNSMTDDSCQSEPVTDLLLLYRPYAPRPRMRPNLHDPMRSKCTRGVGSSSGSMTADETYEVAGGGAQDCERVRRGWEKVKDDIHRRADRSKTFKTISSETRE